MKITIAHIAERAGVSKATVSRVLNNRPEGVGAETRARIQKILSETGFQPSGVARGLATGKSRSIGLIIPDITNPFHPLLVRGVEEVLSRSGYSLFLCNSACDIVKEKEYVRILMEKGVDGVILNSSESDCDCQLELLDARGVPVVLLDRIIDGDSPRVGVFVDNREGARQAAAHLLSRETSSLVFLNGPVDLSQSVLRLAGIEDVLSEKGLSPPVLRVLNGDYSIDSGFRLTSELLDQGPPGKPPFNALFACNDLMAVGALRALKQRGIAVPEQVEVIGFDDIELAHLVEPPLSTVAQPALEMGARSAELLLRLIDGTTPPPQTAIMKPKLVLRGTTRALSEAAQ